MAIKRKLIPGLSAILESIRNSVLPSGAIVWFGNRSTAPNGWAICDGTNGTPNLIGRYPLGSKTSVGQQVAAGLPNIKGTFNGVKYNSISGAFTQANTSYELCGAKEHIRIMTVTLDASRSSSIYGNSSTVTPPSTRLLPCMKL